MRGPQDATGSPDTIVNRDLSFQSLVLDLSAQLIEVDASNVDERVRQVLASIGEFVQADRSYVFLMREEGNLADNTHEWCSPHAAPAADRLQGLDLDRQLPWFGACMRRFEVFHAPRVADLPPEARSEREEFEAENIKSLVVVPMVRRAELYGFLGFDAVTAERDWSADAVAVLRIVGQMLLSVLERAKVERQLMRSEDRFRSLVENTSDWVWEVDAEGVYTYVSPKVRELLGWEPHEVQGRSAFDLMPPDERERMRKEFEAHAEQRAQLRGLVNRLQHRDGHEVWVETNGVPLLDAGGALVGYRGIDRDISERKLAEDERQTLDARMRESQRLESLGLLAGGIAHDFNNLLTAVMGQASLARLMLPPDHEVQRSLRLVSEAAQRASELTRQLLAYSGRAPFVRTVVDMSAVAREMGPLLEASTSTKGLLAWELDDAPRLVECDVSQLRQIVMNLAINACDAVQGREHPRVVIATGASPLTIAELDQSFFDPSADGQMTAWLEVRDNGPGISPDVLGRMFDPFVSTKSQSRGLGLSAVLGIVRGHRGGLRVRTSPEQGTSFQVLLPLGGRAPQAEPVTDTRPPRRSSGQGCVLVIDDDALVRSAAAMILRAQGYSVHEASDGESGLRVYGEHHDEIDVVLLDMTMPGMNGAQVAERLRAVNPRVRILVASGFPAAETAERMAANPPAGYLEKPYSAEALLDELGKLVGPSSR